MEENKENLKSLVKYSKPVMMNISMKKTVEKNIYFDFFNNEHLDTNTDDILNSILPPREYTKDKHMIYLEHVLNSPATTADVVQLEKVIKNNIFMISIFLILDSVVN